MRFLTYLCFTLVLTSLCIAQQVYKPAIKYTADAARIYTGSEVATAGANNASNTTNMVMCEKVTPVNENSAAVKVVTRASSKSAPNSPAHIDISIDIVDQLLRSSLGNEKTVDNSTGDPKKKPLVTDPAAKLTDYFSVYGLTLAFPENGVKVGDTWKFNGKQVIRQFIAFSTIWLTGTYDVSYTLTAAKPYQGKTWLYIDSDWKLDCPKQTVDIGISAGQPAGKYTDEYSMQQEVKASLVYNLEDGVIFSTQYERTNTIKTTMETSDGSKRPFNMKSTTKGTLTRDYDLKKYADVIARAASAPIVDTSPLNW